jgi:hypothetical protein
MSLHGSSQLPFSSDGVDGCFRKNGVSELTSGAASEVRRFSQLGRLKKRPQLGNFSYEPPFSYKLHIDFKNSFTETYYRHQIWWNRKQGNGKETAFWTAHLSRTTLRTNMEDLSEVLIE